MTRADERIVIRFIGTHGKAALRTLVEGLQAGRSYADLGRELGLSREYVRQVADRLGTSVRIYSVFPEVQAVADENTPSLCLAGGPRIPSCSPDEDED